jgi:hypothetical protein
MVKSIIGTGGTNHVVKGQINLPLNFDGKVVYQYFQISITLANRKARFVSSRKIELFHIYCAYLYFKFLWTEYGYIFPSPF